MIANLLGCATLVSKPPATVLLQDDRIYTVPAGQEIKVELDHKPMNLTFPYPMKLMSIDAAVRNEQNLNNAMLDKVRADKDNAKKLGIIGSIFAALAMGLGIFFKMKSWVPKISAKVDIK